MPFERTFDESHEPLQVVCRHLRSKAIYMSGEMEPSAEMQQSGSGHCWCNMTQTIFGPDSGVVERGGCHSGRTCYEAVV